MTKAKEAAAATKLKRKLRAQPKSVGEKSKLRAEVRGKHRVAKRRASPPKRTSKSTSTSTSTSKSKSKPKPPILTDLTTTTSSSPPGKNTKPSTGTPQKCTSTSERVPGIHSPITRSLSLSLSKSPTIPNFAQAPRPPDYCIQAMHVRDITPGTIVWLPAKADLVANAHVDPKLHANAFDHPAVIVSVPHALDISPVVEIALVC
ncbi:hypothetical protein DSL72_005627 [Monilinia vaccinii-corymbosi]|uniref:Uncharacterized protein n=1 Tax=Monilinia vaccinii-corymbosi TaxID=61207 RepID=A0A8A3PFN5_9HELO|nr:hypothetical protein DSL72_005627 [Monilinia vaccinii-corymbosi]